MSIKVIFQYMTDNSNPNQGRLVCCLIQILQISIYIAVFNVHIKLTLWGSE